jgi:hypothetical protein
MEPRNVGLILWHKGTLRARFLDAGEAGFVVNKSTFHSRISELMAIVAKDKIVVPGQAPISKSDEKCIDVLTSIQDEEYLLVDSGYVPDDIPVRDIPKAIDFLFKELVSIDEPDLPPIVRRSKTLEVRCNSLLEKTGFTSRKDFKTKFPVQCPVYGVLTNWHFTCGLGNGHPDALIERVVVSKEQSVNSCALMFGSIVNAAILTKNHCGALIQASDINSEFAEERVGLLNQVCTVIDVESSDASQRLNALAPAKSQSL